MPQVSITQEPEGHMGLESRGDKDANKGFLPLNFKVNIGDVDGVVYVANRPYRVLAIEGAPWVAEGGALTLTVLKFTSGQDPTTQGTALHTGTFNLNGTADTVQSLTMATGTTPDLADGECIAFRLSAAVATAQAGITITLAPK